MAPLAKLEKLVPKYRRLNNMATAMVCHNHEKRCHQQKCLKTLMDFSGFPIYYFKSWIFKKPDICSLQTELLCWY